MAEQDYNEVLKVGLTGGIASGKSTVADMFAELGVPVIDTDVIAREIVRPGQPALQEIRQQFGDGVFAHAGNIDRAALRNLIFSDSVARTELETILHPKIGMEVVRQSSIADGSYQIIVVPLLVHSPLRNIIDRVLLVDCTEESQIKQLVARDGTSIEQAQQALAAQSSRSQRHEIADDVILNDQDLTALRHRVDSLNRFYASLANC